MKFIHTSDWHVGRTIRGRSRASEHEAALQELLKVVQEQEVDAVLISGDVFDTSTPLPDAERLVFSFFRELYGLGTPAVVIAGNHDHPSRFQALAPLLEPLGIHLRGEPTLDLGKSMITIQSRDGRETAEIAAVPWVAERQVVDLSDLIDGTRLAAYEERVSRLLSTIATGYSATSCKLMLAHLLADNSVIGSGGGERELTLGFGIYGVPAGMLPSAAQYIALGHVHKTQTIRRSPRVCYSGSLLQLDFGEQNQDKHVLLVDVHPGANATVEPIQITGGRPLYDVGSASQGVALNDLPAYAEKFPEDSAWLRVYMDVDIPVANLPALVRETLPNAVHIERVQAGGQAESSPRTSGLGPIEMFQAFYQSDLGRGREPSKETVDLFRHLLEEETLASN